jgi:hypothetical protein
MRIIEDDNVWMDVKDTAKYLKMSINTLKKVMRTPEFPITWFNKRLARVNKEDLNVWMTECSHKQKAKQIAKDMAETIAEEGKEHYE